MCFEELYMEDNLEGKEMYESVVSVLHSLFKEWSERHGRASGGKSDQAKTSNTQSSECSREMSMIMSELVDDDIGYKRIDRRYKSILRDWSERKAGWTGCILERMSWESRLDGLCRVWCPFILEEKLYQVSNTVTDCKGCPCNAGIFYCIRECFQYRWKDHRPI